MVAANDPLDRAPPWEKIMRARRIFRSVMLATSLAGLTLLMVISTVAACTNGNGFP